LSFKNIDFCLSWKEKISVSIGDRYCHLCKLNSVGCSERCTLSCNRIMAAISDFL
jgi:hypothetical protein